MSGTEAILNGLHPSMKFTIELPVSDKIPFVMKLKTRIELSTFGTWSTIVYHFVVTTLVL